MHEPEQDITIAEILRSPIALHHDLLVHGTSTELRFWNATTMARLGTLELEARAFCFLQDGTLAVFVQESGQKRCELQLIDRNREVRILPGPEFESAIDSELVPGGSSNTIYVSDENYEITRFDLHEHELRKSGAIKVDLGYWRRLRQLVSLGDGRVMTRGEAKLYVSEPAKRTVEYATGNDIPVHLAAAARARVWYSHFAGTPAPPRAITLAALGDGLAVQARIDLAPANIDHLHAGGAALAVLAYSEASRWQVIVFEETGAERWRADVPAAYAHDGSPQRFGHVAISEQRVVLRKSGSDILLAWDAETGKPIG